MTATELGKALGIGRRTLFRYRKEYPDRAPKTFDSLEEWTAFAAEMKIYDSDQTKPKIDPAESEAKDVPAYDAQAERKERIIKLRLINESKQLELKLSRRELVPLQEAIETLSIIATTVRAELMEIPGEVAEALSGKEAAEVQRYLEAVIRKPLEKLSWPESFLKPKARMA